MSEQHDLQTINLKPIISYPRQAEPGQSYLMTIDVQLASLKTPWPYPEEEYPIFFLLDTYPYFSHASLDDRQPVVVLHRFGGTYGPAKYLLTATREAVEPGSIHVTLINAGGLPIGHLDLPCTIVSEAAPSKSRMTTLERQTRKKRQSEPPAPQIAAISTTPPTPSAETAIRHAVEEQLMQAGWVIQDAGLIDLDAGPGIAIREFSISSGYADYLLVVNGEATGIIEVKGSEATLVGVREQSIYYQAGQPWPTTGIRFLRTPLPFSYETNGHVIQFTNQLEPDARTRSVFHFHRPETLARWLSQAPVGTPNELNDLLRSRLRRMPPLEQAGLRSNQFEAIQNLEASLATNHPRILIQMATGSGKTHTMVQSAYRLLKHGGARRILFLVDRKLLAYQTLEALRQFTVEDTGQPFRTIYNTQLLENNRLDSATGVCITTIQRLYTLLTNESISAERDIELFDEEDEAAEHIRIVHYDPVLPIDFFDVIIVDECHRSIYSHWRSALEYFDAFLIGYTSTPDNRAYAFFSRNLVYRYSSEDAINDGIRAPYEIYRIRTEISEHGSTINQGNIIEKRDERGIGSWEQLTDDLLYTRRNLNREIVAIDQIRVIIRAFRDALFTELFPERKPETSAIPKTVIFAKNEMHAEDIVRIVREEFGEGNAFAKKITSYATEGRAEELVQQFRSDYYPRIAVTVNMLTGLDIKPLEIVVLLRPVKSRILRQQMIELGCRTISDEALQAVTPGAHKNHYVVIDAVGITEDIAITNTPRTQERQKQSLKDLLDIVADLEDFQDAVDLLSSLAFELMDLRRKLTSIEVRRIEQITGMTLEALATQLEEASNSENWLMGVDIEAMDVQSIDASGLLMMESACEPFKNKAFCDILLRAWRRKAPQIIDNVSSDQVISAGFETPSEIHETLKQETLHHRFSTWLTTYQQTRSQPLTDEQILWLERIRNHIATAGPFTEHDFERSPFIFDGGLVAARVLFGAELPRLLEGLNRALSPDA